MFLTFKAGLQKRWTLCDDKITMGSKDISLADITQVTHLQKGTSKNGGVIFIMIKDQPVSLAYPSSDTENGDIAFKYIFDNFGSKEARVQRKPIDEFELELSSLPKSQAWEVKKEISELPSLLRYDEKLKAICTGLTGGNTWLIVCTTKRILMVDKGLFYGVKQLEIPLNRITSFSHSEGLVFGTISITDGAETRTIKNISNDTISHFTEAVHSGIESLKTPTPAPAPVMAISAADEILKFKQLLDLGVITEDEFIQKKNELLGL